MTGGLGHLPTSGSCFRRRHHLSVTIVRNATPDDAESIGEDRLRRVFSSCPAGSCGGAAVLMCGSDMIKDYVVVR